MITRIYFWSIPKRNLLWAVLRMWLNRRPLKNNPNIKFWKLLGTGKGLTFTLETRTQHDGDCWLCWMRNR